MHWSNGCALQYVCIPFFSTIFLEPQWLFYSREHYRCHQISQRSPCVFLSNKISPNFRQGEHLVSLQARSFHCTVRPPSKSILATQYSLSMDMESQCGVYLLSLYTLALTSGTDHFLLLRHGWTSAQRARIQLQQPSHHIIDQNRKGLLQLLTSCVNEPLLLATYTVPYTT